MIQVASSFFFSDQNFVNFSVDLCLLRSARRFLGIVALIMSGKYERKVALGHTMKTYRGINGMDPLILSFGTGWI